MIDSGVRLRFLGAAIFASVFFLAAPFCHGQIKPEYSIRQHRDNIEFSVALTEPQPYYDLRWFAPSGREMGYTQHVTESIRAKSLEELKQRVLGDWTLHVSGKGADTVYHFQVDLSELTEGQLASVRLIEPAQGAVLTDHRPTIRWESARAIGLPVWMSARLNLNEPTARRYQKLTDVDLSQPGSFRPATDQGQARMSVRWRVDGGCRRCHSTRNS